MNGHHEGSAAQSAEAEVEPHMAVLNMHDVRLRIVDEAPYPAQETELTKWLAKPRFLEQVTLDCGIEQVEVRRGECTRQGEVSVDALSAQTVCQPYAVLGPVVGEQENSDGRKLPVSTRRMIKPMCLYAG